MSINNSTYKNNIKNKFFAVYYLLCNMTHKLKTIICVFIESVIVTPASTPQTPRCAPTAIDFSEQKHWWQLEEVSSYFGIILTQLN